MIRTALFTAVVFAMSAHGSGVMDVLSTRDQQQARSNASSTMGGGGCATMPVRGDSMAPGQDLAICLAPVQDPAGSVRNLNVGPRSGMREVPSATATDGCDVMVLLVQRSGEEHFDYTVASARSGTQFMTGQRTNWTGVTSMLNGLAIEIRGQFGPGTPGFQTIKNERVKAGGVAERDLVYADPARQAEVAKAEHDGDAALAAGDKKAAFNAYAAGLKGPYSDDPGSLRLRPKLMKLLATYHDVPPVPEEARRFMVRSKAVLNGTPDASAHLRASGELVHALEIAPWWSALHYNLGLLDEKQGLINDAIGNFKLYLLANPDAADARVVQDKIYALEVRTENARP